MEEMNRLLKTIGLEKGTITLSNGCEAKLLGVSSSKVFLEFASGTATAVSIGWLIENKARMSEAEAIA